MEIENLTSISLRWSQWTMKLNKSNNICWLLHKVKVLQLRWDRERQKFTVLFQIQLASQGPDWKTLHSTFLSATTRSVTCAAKTQRRGSSILLTSSGRFRRELHWTWESSELAKESTLTWLSPTSTHLMRTRTSSTKLATNQPFSKAEKAKEAKMTTPT